MQMYFAKLRAARWMTFLEAARELQTFCDRQGWKSSKVGGLTRAIGLTLIAGFGTEESFVRAWLAEYPGRISDAASFARKNRVLLLQSRDGIGIDVSLGALPFEELAIRHATEFSFAPGLSIRTCSAEDLLVLKLFACRPLDLRDAEGVALRQGERLDWDTWNSSCVRWPNSRASQEFWRRSRGCAASNLCPRRAAWITRASDSTGGQASGIYPAIFSRLHPA